jgi:hypothetical protein
MHIQGCLVNGSCEGKEVAIVRREFSRQQQFDALFNIGDPACNPAKRYSTIIGFEGRFAIDLPSFLSGDPIWIIPPLGTLVPLGTRADNRGLIVLLKTPEPEAQVYEIDVRGDKPSIRILKGSNWKFQKLSPSEQTKIRVVVETVTTNLTATFSIKTRDVRIDISK